jgi:hypothetical protein
MKGFEVVELVPPDQMIVRERRVAWRAGYQSGRSETEALALERGRAEGFALGQARKGWAILACSVLSFWLGVAVAIAL